MINSDTSANPKAISRISVERLFGTYSYEIPCQGVTYADLSKLLILYGENGSGKTTILNLVYNILATAAQRGHRTYIARQPFKRFEVEIADGTRIIADRKGDNLDGAFEWSVSKQHKTIAKVSLPVDERKAVAASLLEKIEDKHLEVIKAIEDLDIQLYFLSDDRKILGQATEAEEDEEWYRLEGGEIVGGKMMGRRLYRRDKSQGLPLDEAIENLVHWIRTQAFRGSSLGETSVSAIYSSVIKSIASAYPSTSTPYSDTQLSQLLDSIDSLSAKNEEFSKLGLMPPLHTEEIARMVRDPNIPNKDILHAVTKPYVDSIKARFDALEEIKNLINTFIHNMNDFYIDKHVYFDLTKGLRILSYQGQELSPSILSSGEKQLLLLFCHTIVALEKSSIVIIDEPEISLNVTWQRNLIRALLDCVGRGYFQLLLATHSLELLTQYKNHVVRLSNVASNAKK
jgi:energy-coupling factor transporter ATP-binding protein EcfA2